MKIEIDRSSDQPVYLQISEQIRRQILSGELTAGFRLPPERKLADSLGVNRTTVLNAYRELKTEGLVDSHVGIGTVVLASPEDEATSLGDSAQAPAWNQFFSQYSSRFDSNVVKDLLQLASRKDLISFATGIASPQSGPIEALSGIEQELIGNRNFKALLHSPTEGFTSLREAICDLMQKRGVYCQYDEVMLLAGSQQGIDLAARIFLDPGDIVVVEEASFFPAVQVFKAIGARVISIPIDEHGMRVDLLEDLLKRYRPKLIYTMPTFHNPTGVEMSLERRKMLIDLANHYKVLILEDDAYGDLCYDGQLLPMLKAMDNNGYVIYLSTFSKNIYSGLRLGWMVAHRKVIKRFAAAKQIMDLHSSSLSQWIVERFMTDGLFETHLVKVCRDYRMRRDLMIDALARCAPPGLSWNRPRGGYYIWCKLPAGISASRLVAKAAERQVVFVPGSAFCPAGQGDDHLRLNFTFAPVKDIEVGIGRLCEAMKELLAENQETDLFEEIEINPIV